MKLKDIRDLTTPELGSKLNEAYQEMFNLRFQLASRQLANYQRIGEVKRTIAQIKTIQREHELAAAAESRSSMETVAQARSEWFIGDKMQKTVVVAVESTRRHPLYKLVKQTKRFKAHAGPVCKAGDRVRIVETRPLTRKRTGGWMLSYDRVSRSGRGLEMIQSTTRCKVADNTGARGGDVHPGDEEWPGDTPRWVM